MVLGGGDHGTGLWKCRKDDMFELQSAYIVNVLINIKLRHTIRHALSLFGWFTFVEVTSRCPCCPIVRTCKYFFNLILSIQGSMSQDPPNMFAYTSCRPLLHPCYPTDSYLAVHSDVEIARENELKITISQEVSKALKTVQKENVDTDDLAVYRYLKDCGRKFANCLFSV